MARVIAVAQHKGGVGKTATCVSLGAVLAEKGKAVLLIDLDPQAAMTLSLGINPAEQPLSLYDVLAQPDIPLADIVRPSPVPGLALAPGHINLSVAEMQFSGRVGRERILKKKLDPTRDQYHYILLDCGPTLGLLTINALTAADSVIIPIQCEMLSLYGLKYLLDTVALVREELNDRLAIEGFLLTMYDARIALSEDVVQNVRKTFGDKVFRTVIRRRVKLAEAPATGRPITLYATDSEAAADYRSLAEELLNHG